MVTTPYSVSTTLPNQVPKVFGAVSIDAIAGNTNMKIGVSTGAAGLDYSIGQDGVVEPGGSTGPSYIARSCVVFAYDQNTGNLWIGIANQNIAINWVGGGDPGAGTNPSFSGLSGSQYITVQAGPFTDLGTVTLYATLAELQSSGFSILYPPPSGYSSWSGQ